MMKSSKSVRIGVIFFISLLCLGITFVLTYGAFSGSAKSVGTVRFEVTDVEGTVKANYYLNSDTPTPLYLESDGTTQTVVFTPESTSEGVGSLTTGTGEVRLKSEAPYVVFEYVFTNTSSLSYGNYYATLSYTINAENVLLYAISNQKNGLANPYTNVSMETPINGTTLFANVQVPVGGNEVHLYVVAKIDKLYLNTILENIDFKWTLKNQALVL